MRLFGNEDMDTPDVEMIIEIGRKEAEFETEGREKLLTSRRRATKSLS